MDINARIEKVQEYMQKHHIDGWLLYDFQARNRLALQFLQVPQNAMLTRPLFYWIPSKGAPKAVVHAVEVDVVKHLPGEKKVYTGRHTLQSLLEKELSHASTIAMEFSPLAATPNVSFVDGGTIDLIRSFGKEIIGSGNILQEALCVLTEEQLVSHTFAASVIRKALDKSWESIRTVGKGISEYELQQGIIETFRANGCIFHGGPIVAFAENAANPHYEVPKSNSRKLQENDIVLIDLWCKKDAEQAVYADVTEVGVYAKQPSERQRTIFDAVLKAQREAFALLENRYVHGEIVKGFELDEVARKSIEESGFGQYFTHRLGHNIFTSDHGPGANLDSFESLDERQLIRGTCFSIEPGIYVPGEIGIRLECDVYIPEEGAPQITTGQQSELIHLQ